MLKYVVKYYGYFVLVSSYFGLVSLCCDFGLVVYWVNLFLVVLDLGGGMVYGVLFWD